MHVSFVSIRLISFSFYCHLACSTRHRCIQLSFVTIEVSTARAHTRRVRKLRMTRTKSRGSALSMHTIQMAGTRWRRHRWLLIGRLSNYSRAARHSVTQTGTWSYRRLHGVRVLWAWQGGRVKKPYQRLDHFRKWQLPRTETMMRWKEQRLHIRWHLSPSYSASAFHAPRFTRACGCGTHDTCLLTDRNYFQVLHRTRSLTTTIRCRRCSTRSRLPRKYGSELTDEAVDAALPTNAVLPSFSPRTKLRKKARETNTVRTDGTLRRNLHALQVYAPYSI